MKMVRLSKSCVGEEEKAALSRVIDGEYLGMGKEVQMFEQEIAEFLQTSNEVICVGTGTAALHLTLSCLDIGPGDEVLVPSITYVASFQAIAATGAKPIACDVTENQVFIDLHDAAKRLTNRTKAIMPVHYASDSQNMDAVYAFAKQHSLRVIEDAAHAFGCSRDGKKVGASGDVICFSFDGIKNITSGEGGAIVTGDIELARRLKDSRLLGVEKDTDKRFTGQRSWFFDVHHQGFRYHMSNLMAAIGREQLKKVEQFSQHRKSCVVNYRRDLAGIPKLNFFDFDYENIVPHIIPVRITGDKRDELLEKLRSTGIECGIHYQPNHLLKYFKTSYRLPVTEMLQGELLSIPLHAELSEYEQCKVINCITSFFSAR